MLNLDPAMASRNLTTRRSKIPMASQPAGAMPSVKVDTVAAAAPPKGGRKAKKSVKSEAGKAENGKTEGGKSSAPAAQVKRSVAEKEAGAEGRWSTLGWHLSVVDTNRGGSRGSAGDPPRLPPSTTSSTPSSTTYSIVCSTLGSSRWSQWTPADKRISDASQI